MTVLDDSTRACSIDCPRVPALDDSTRASTPSDCPRVTASTPLPVMHSISSRAVSRVEGHGWSGARVTDSCAGDVGLDLQQRACGPRRAHLLRVHAVGGQHEAAVLPEGALARRLVASPDSLARSSSSLSISPALRSARSLTPPTPPPPCHNSHPAVSIPQTYTRYLDR